MTLPYKKSTTFLKYLWKISLQIFPKILEIPLPLCYIFMLKEY